MSSCVTIDIFYRYLSQNGPCHQANAISDFLSMNWRGRQMPPTIKTAFERRLHYDSCACNSIREENRNTLLGYGSHLRSQMTTAELSSENWWSPNWKLWALLWCQTLKHGNIVATGLNPSTVTDNFVCIHSYQTTPVKLMVSESLDSTRNVAISSAKQISLKYKRYVAGKQNIYFRYLLKLSISIHLLVIKFL